MNFIFYLARMKLIVFLKNLLKFFQTKKGTKIISIKSDHGGNFENCLFDNYYIDNGIHNFPAPRTPQQNSVVERKNRSLEELARTMTSEGSLSKYFWANTINTTCYVLNRIMIRPILNKTPSELFNGWKPNISHLHIFCTK